MSRLKANRHIRFHRYGDVEGGRRLPCPDRPPVSGRSLESCVALNDAELRYNAGKQEKWQEGRWQTNLPPYSSAMGNGT